MTRRAPRIRSWRGILGTYVERSTFIHRTPPTVKFLALAVATIVLTVVRSLPLAAAAVIVAFAIAAWARITPPRLLVMLRIPLFSLVPVAVLGSWQRGWVLGLEVPLDLLAAIGLAVVMTATTRADRLIDALVRAASPLRSIGLSAERFALAISLMLRTIPALLSTMTEVRDAAVARGLERSPRAYLVPFAVRAVGRAHATGDALAARGLGDD